MQWSSYMLGYRDFYSEDKIIDYIKNSKNYNPDKDNLQVAKALKVFQTSKQQTWLVATNERAYYILDDNKKDKPQLFTWSLPKKDITVGNRVSLEIKTGKKSEKTGLVRIGPRHENWFYSKRLFPEEKHIVESIHKLIREAMLQAP